ncbi:MAG: fasciclin domain-containing protein [Saprospiraceae bacterium]|nr:fasciclin domain-containing protein [Saprospiraceae bacterium]
MKSNKIFSGICFLFVLLFTITSCEKDFENEKPSIANIAVSNADFSTLEAAAIQGGVAVVLSNPNAGDPSGAFTVFAPNNAAFAKLGLVDEGSFAALNTGFLTNTLLYHVSNGNLTGSSIQNNGQSASALGPNRRFIKRGNDTYINGSKILATDVEASNGTVHVIDKVLIASGADIVQTALALTNSQVFSSPELTYLVEAVLYAELAGALSASAGSPSFTVYAPTDAAFRQLGLLLGVPLNVPADVRKLPKETVAAVLLNHVIVDGGKFTSEYSSNTSVTIGGNTLSLGSFTDGTYTVKGNGNGTAVANIVIPDVLTTNGVVHVIDRVLLP